MVFGKKQHCSQCGKLCQDIHCFINPDDGKIWCSFCYAKRKKKKKDAEWGDTKRRWHQKF